MSCREYRSKLKVVTEEIYRTEGHQRLKRFLHPNCDTCNLEFPSRMEWVEHRFTPEHLFKVKEILDAKSGDTEGHITEENLEWDNEPLLQENLQTEDENPVLELDDDLSNLYNRVPVYKSTRPVGKNNLKPVEGFFCDICKRFLRNDTDAQVFFAYYGENCFVILINFL